MLLKVLIAIILLILPFRGISQDINDPMSILKQKAIPIENLSDLSSKIYGEICNYNVIMLGEMHGTNEPAKFAGGLCNLITKNEEKVILAIEIPSSLMGEIPIGISAEQLEKMDFFKRENVDGRNGEAWFQLIMQCSQNDRIKIHFFDNEYSTSRDSSMYIELVRIKRLYPDSKIITLTGNIHNWLKPFRDELKLGGYLVKDTINFNPDRIMSVNHVYKEGTMLNNVGNGLELKTIVGKDNFYNLTISSKTYLCPRVFENQNQYTHFLYTEKVTHSNRLNKRDIQK